MLRTILSQRITAALYAAGVAGIVAVLQYG